jgi:hypothetical protein
VKGIFYCFSRSAPWVLFEQPSFGLASGGYAQATDVVPLPPFSNLGFKDRQPGLGAALDRLSELVIPATEYMTQASKVLFTATKAAVLHVHAIVSKKKPTGT